MTDHQPELTDSEPSFQCRHILTGGHRCGSPTLRGEHFCYYHHTTRKPVPKAELDARETRKARRAAFDLPRPDDRGAIQAAIGEILLRLAANQLDPRRAGLLLYGLQIASINLPPRQPAPDPAETVEEVEIHPEHGLIAPVQDFESRPPASHLGKSLEQLLQEDWRREEAREDQRHRETAKPFILEDLDATADTTSPFPPPYTLPPTPGVHPANAVAVAGFSFFHPRPYPIPNQSSQPSPLFPQPSSLLKPPPPIQSTGTASSSGLRSRSSA